MIGDVGKNSATDSTIVRHLKTGNKNNHTKKKQRFNVIREVNLLEHSCARDLLLPLIKETPLPYPIPQSTKQREFNQEFRRYYKNLVALFFEHKSLWLSIAQSNPSKTFKFKLQPHILPWTVYIHSNGEVVVHYHKEIVEKEDYKGATKSDKRALLVETHTDLAKMSVLVTSPKIAEIVATEKKYLLYYRDRPNIVKLHFFTESLKKTKTTFYLTYYSNGPLKIRNDFTFEEKKRIILGMLNGLCTLHRNKWSREGQLLPATVHNDLKPENILLDENNVPHIADFGLSCEDQSKVKCRGSVYYMSPKKLRFYVDNYGTGHSLKANKAEDIWAMGCIIYELLTGVTVPWNHQFEDLARIKRHKSLTGIDEDHFSLMRRSTDELEKGYTGEENREEGVSRFSSFYDLLSNYYDHVKDFEKFFPEPKSKTLHICWEMMSRSERRRISAEVAMIRFHRVFS